MKLIKYTAAALALASCASNTQLYEVTHVIAESDSTIDVWSSNAFIRTDIQVTPTASTSLKLSVNSTK